MSQREQDLKSIAQEWEGRREQSFSKAVLAPLARFWWLELVAGVFWLVVAAVVLKFNHASVVTVGILTGILFLVAAAEQFMLAVIDPGWTRWAWALFGVLLTAAGIVSLIHPRETFVGFADVLGFVFLLIGIMWTVQAFAEETFNRLWWLNLTSGILLIVLAFWTSGEFFLTRAATLLVFAGIWCAVKGVNDIARAFEIRKLAA